jgi:tRNA/rRNA methyltransferase
VSLIERVDIILVEPSEGGNVGSCARALKNMGFAQFDMVRPRYTDTRAATTMAVHAKDLLHGSHIHATLEAAIAKAHWVVATSGRRRSYPERKVPLTPEQVVKKMQSLPTEARVAVVFGPERIGLTAEELGLCQDLLVLPTAQEYPILNLAQAVLLVAYEIRRADLAKAMPKRSKRRTVSADRLDGLVAHLRHTLGTVGFLNKQNPRLILDDLRFLFSRAALDERELQLLRGILHRVDVTIARLGGPPTLNQVKTQRKKSGVSAKRS